MAIDLNRVGFHVTLPEDFEEQINAVMEDEFKIAQNKWRVTLERELVEKVTEFAKDQLSRKVSETSKSNWNFAPILTLKVKGIPKSGNKDVHLPKDAAKIKGKIFIIARDGWELTSEVLDETMEADEICDAVMRNILTWARTAVFYGVGSFKL